MISYSIFALGTKLKCMFTDNINSDFGDIKKAKKLNQRNKAQKRKVKK